VIDSRRPFRPLLAAYVAAVQSAYTTPALLGAVTDSLGLPADQAGLISTLELLGFAVAGLLLAPRLDRLPRSRLAHLSGLVLACAHLASAAADGFAHVAMARAVAGLAAGTLMATTTAEIAHFPDAERKYARCSATAVLVGCLGLFVVPTVAGRYGHLGAYAYAGVIVLVLLPLTRGWPAPVERSERPRGDVGGLLPLFGFALLLFFSDGLVYPFSERMARALGLGEILGLLLPAALAMGFVGATVAERVGTRWGHIRPLVLAGWATALAGFAMTYAIGAVSFGVAAGLKNLTLFFLFPYVLGAAAVRDPSGRGAAAVTGVIPLGVSIGPYVGGILVEASGFRILGWVSLAAITLATPMALALRRQSPPNPSA